MLQAAGTKWNLPFKPGLVGGHCIGIDPYYLTHKAQSIGHHPEIILSGRRINDNMCKHVVSQLIKAMLAESIVIKSSRVLVLGITFKENCPDLRNSKVFDVIRELESYGVNVDCCDPWCDPCNLKNQLEINLVNEPENFYYDSVLIAVAHDQFKNWGIEKIRKFCKTQCVLYDIKNVFPKDSVDLRL